MEDKTANNKINVGTLNKFNESKTKRQLNAAPTGQKNTSSQRKYWALLKDR